MEEHEWKMVMALAMIPGSIVMIAAFVGGNCALTKLLQYVKQHGVDSLVDKCNEKLSV